MFTENWDLQTMLLQETTALVGKTLLITQIINAATDVINPLTDQVRYSSKK